MSDLLPVGSFVRVSSLGHAEAEVKKAQIESEIPRLQGELDFLREQLQNTEQAVSEARAVRLLWDSFGSEEKRELVEQIVRRITVGEKQVSIELIYLPGVFQPSQTQK